MKINRRSTNRYPVDREHVPVQEEVVNIATVTNSHYLLIANERLIIYVANLRSQNPVALVTSIAVVGVSRRSQLDANLFA